MLRLALDTSTRQGSVALADDGMLLGEAFLSVRATHSETLLCEVERLLEVGGRRVTDLDAVVVGAGPGSFTGVRIAASVAKGLCFGGRLPLYAYSSLLAVVEGSGVAESVCAMFDARRGEVYALAVRRLNPRDVALGPVAVPVEAVLEQLGAVRDWSFVGDGAASYRESITEAGGFVLPDDLAHPRARILLRLARRWPEEGRVPVAAEWQPEYVRRWGERPPWPSGSASTE
ncbi:MAG: tRNA (adenosine(37)-N6)-threonylcarbamoyltransferase complex dimerization subunit type 1 TsaB [Gemmatimonadota bacterium]